jgi:hypothetical protein
MGLEEYPGVFPRTFVAGRNIRGSRDGVVHTKFSSPRSRQGVDDENYQDSTSLLVWLYQCIEFPGWMGYVGAFSQTDSTHADKHTEFNLPAGLAAHPVL